MSNETKPWPYEWCDPITLSGTAINERWKNADSTIKWYIDDNVIINEAMKRFAKSAQYWQDIDERSHYDWLRFGQGSNWPDIPPNRLFGAYWVGDGCVG